jgi:hypothetical protein
MEPSGDNGLTLHLLRASDFDSGQAAPARGAGVSRQALDHVLRTYLGPASAPVALRVGSQGKPELSCGTVQFNLSHAGEWIYVAVAPYAVGIDLEVDRPLRAWRTLADYFDRLGSFAVHASPHQVCRQWSRAEAVAKCIGIGMTEALGGLHLPCGDLEGVTRVPTEYGPIWLAEVPAPAGLMAHVAARAEFDGLTLAGDPPRQIKLVSGNRRHI